MRLVELFAQTRDIEWSEDPKELADRLTAKYSLEDLWIYNLGNSTIKLDSIRVISSVRKEGIGTAVMQEITDYADRNGLRIVLSPGHRDDDHGTTSRGRLVKFYKRFGFKENKGRNKDFTISAGMIREPQQSITENTILPMKKPNKYGHVYSKWEDKTWRNKIMRIAQKVIDTYPDACTVRGNWQMKGNPNKDLYGQCGPLSFYLWKALGEPTDFVPYSIMYGEEEHVILYNKKQDVALDIAGNQFDMPFFHPGPGPGYPGDLGYTHMRKISKKSIAHLED